MQVSSDELHLATASRSASTRVRVSIARMAAGFLVFLLAGLGHAQPPGTYPPRELITESPEGGTGEGLEISGFMFLDVSGNQIMVPRMTFERLRELESGSKKTQRSFAFKSLQIDGTADGGRAELDLQLRLAIDPTGGQLVPIPLRMGNFHLLRSPEFLSTPAVVSENNFERMTIGPDGSGYVLWVRADRPRETVVKMSVSARVDQSSRDSLYFRLPDVPSKIKIVVPQTGVIGEINGRGDEVIFPPVKKSGRTEFRIESGGGNFQLNWGRQTNVPATTAQFQVETSVSASWNAPQDRPVLSIQWSIRSLRGQVGVFEVQLPPGAELDGDPVLVSSGRNVKVNKLDEQGRIELVVPADERQESIDLSLKLKLAAAAADGWLDFQIPRIIGALRQAGDVVLTTVGDYRLRWRSSLGIQRTLSDFFDAEPNARSYTFQFDRGGFAIPILLSAQQQRLRLACESEIVLGDNSATLEMTIRTSGEAADSRQVELDFSGWDQHSIVDSETGEDLVISTTKSRAQISLTQDVGGQASLIRVTALQSFSDAGKSISFTLPRISAANDVLVESNQVTIRSSGRSALVVDLENSEAIESVAASSGEAENAMVSHFRIQPPRAQAKIVGSMVEQPPQITLESNATIDLEGNQLVTNVNWLVTSRSNLKGRLDIAIPRPMPGPTSSELVELSSVRQNLDEFNTSAYTDMGGWSVTINGRAGLLQAIDRERYELKSGVLGEGTYEIRWQHSQRIVGDAIQSVSLPRVRNADVEVRGDISVALQGNQDTDLYAADSPQRTSLQFTATPRESIRVRLVKRAVREQELSVRRAVLRTAASQKMRHEQVLALARGGDVFRVSLSENVSNLFTDAYVDNRRVTVSRDQDELSVQLPGDQQSHVIDIRVWLDEPSSGLLPMIKPILKLPIGIGRVYWQIVLPVDSHVVWVAPTMGQAMTWQLDGWRVARRPVLSDKALCERIGVADFSQISSDNSYLYVGSDVLSFQATVASRATIWIFVGGLVLLCAVAMAYLPTIRNPVTAMIAAFLFTGLLALAPDAAVLFGQFAMVAVVLVIVMFTIRSLLVPRGPRLLPRQSGSAASEGSTKSAIGRQETSGSSVRSTEAVSGEPSGVWP